jgi:hypothetical protein
MNAVGPSSIRSELSAISLVATAIWMPSLTVVLAFHPTFANGLVLALMIGGWIGSVLVLALPYAIIVDGDTVTGRWLWGRVRTWPRSELALSSPAHLLTIAFGGRVVKHRGRTVFIVWRLMSHSQLMLEALGQEGRTG